MKRSGSQNLIEVYPVKKKASDTRYLKNETKDARRRYGLQTPVQQSSQRRELATERFLPQQATGPAQSIPGAFATQTEPASPTLGSRYTESVLCSPFAALRQQGFGQGQAQPSSCSRQLADEFTQLITPDAQGDGKQDISHARPENNENVNWLVSPVRPPRRPATAAMLPTPEKEGSLQLIQPMPSLSSWMKPATLAPSKQEGTRYAGAMEDVAASLTFDSTKPRRLQVAPSPLDRLLGEIQDSDFAPSVLQWDSEQQNG